MNKHNDKIKLALILIFAVCVLLIPQAIRFMDQGGLIIGDESYYHGRIAEEITEQGFLSYDSLSFAGRDYNLNLYHYFLVPFVFIFGQGLASMIVPFLCGILSVFFLYLILRRFNAQPLTSTAVIAVWILTPVFIGVFTISSPNALLLLLVITGFYCLIKDKRRYTVLSIILFAAAGFLGIYHLAVLFALALAFGLAKKEFRERCYYVSGVLLLVFLAHYVPSYFSSGFDAVSFIETEFIKNFFSDFGGMMGFTIFTLLLSVLGLAIIWGEKSRYYLLCTIFAGLLILSFVLNKSVIYANIFVSIFAGIAVTRLLAMRWKIKPLKNFAILLIICGLLFSAISFTGRLSDENPNLELQEALVWLKAHSFEQDIVFSHHSNGFWIENIAERPVVMDSLFNYAPSADERYRDSEEILHSLDIRKTQKLLSKYNVSYVVITEDMYNTVWEREGSGLAFLLQNTETFKKEFGNTYVGIWGYIYRE